MAENEKSGRFAWILHPSNLDPIRTSQHRSEGRKGRPSEAVFQAFVRKHPLEALLRIHLINPEILALFKATIGKFSNRARFLSARLDDILYSCVRRGCRMLKKHSLVLPQDKPGGTPGPRRLSVRAYSLGGGIPNRLLSVTHHGTVAFPPFRD